MRSAKAFVSIPAPRLCEVRHGLRVGPERRSAHTGRAVQHDLPELLPRASYLAGERVHLPVNSTRWDHRLSVAGTGKGQVGHAGAVLLRKCDDQTGLTGMLSGALGTALTRAGRMRRDLLFRLLRPPDRDDVFVARGKPQWYST
jgi:hypothetical protein